MLRVAARVYQHAESAAARRQGEGNLERNVDGAVNIANKSYHLIHYAELIERANGGEPANDKHHDVVKAEKPPDACHRQTRRSLGDSGMRYVSNGETHH